MPRHNSSITGYEDDPFLQGSTANKDDGDPFLTDEMNVKRNLLPSSQLQHLLQFCDAKTLLAAAAVNLTWNEEANADAVWKRLCKTKYGSDALRECKAHVKVLGWRMCYFVGICKTVLVNTPDKQAIALVPFPGLTIKHTMSILGLERTSLYMLTGQSFSEDFETKMEDLGMSRGISGQLANSRLCDILIEPCSTIYIEQVPEKMTRSPQHSTGDTSSADPQSLDENQAKEKWKRFAATVLQQYPRFVQQHMGSSQPFLRDFRRRSEDAQKPNLLQVPAKHSLGTGPPVNSPTTFR